MYNYTEYKKLKEGVPTCGECKYFISLVEKCMLFTLKHAEEHFNACTRFDSQLEGDKIDVIVLKKPDDIVKVHDKLFNIFGE